MRNIGISASIERMNASSPFLSPVGREALPDVAIASQKRPPWNVSAKSLLERCSLRKTPDVTGCWFRLERVPVVAFLKAWNVPRSDQLTRR